MLTIKLEVNGRLIGEASIVNEGGPDAATEYPWHAADCHDDGIGVSLRSWSNARAGCVTHDRSKGAWALAAKVLAEVAK